MNPTPQIIDIDEDTQSAPVFICNLTAVSPVMAALELFKTSNGLRTHIPLSTKTHPARSYNAKQGNFLLKMHGPASGTRGWRGLRRWESPTAVPETDYDRETMGLIEQQERVLAQVEAPPVFTLAETMPYAGARPAAAMKATRGVIPDGGWTLEMYQRWMFLNQLEPIPGLDLKTKTGLSAALEQHKNIAKALSKFRTLRPPPELAGVAAAAQAAAHKITAPSPDAGQ